MVSPAKPRNAAPAQAPLIIFGRGKKQAGASLPPDTRVVPRHVYDQRQNTTNVSVPKGYRAVWDDDRLNPRRGERTLRPAQVRGGVNVPKGYRMVGWGDDRLNPRRGQGTVEGDARTSLIWSNTVPRTLIAVPTGANVVTIPVGTAQAQDPQTVVARVSTRSAPAGAPAGGKRRYVRVATYAAEDEARAVAQALARTGLPMRLGVSKSSTNKVVLAGPFTSYAQARAALDQVRSAGYRRARLGK